MLPLFGFFLSHHLGYAINHSESLPHKFYVVLKKNKYIQFKRGDHIVFKAPENFPMKVDLLKKVYGEPGDSIEKIGDDFVINKITKLLFQNYDSKNRPLLPGPVGILPRDHFFVATNHPQSYDSRYKNVGWIKKEDIIGLAYPVW